MKKVFTGLFFCTAVLRHAMFDGHIKPMTAREFHSQTTDLKYSTNWILQVQTGYNY